MHVISQIGNVKNARNVNCEFYLLIEPEWAFLLFTEVASMGYMLLVE